MRTFKQTIGSRDILIGQVRATLLIVAILAGRALLHLSGMECGRSPRRSWLKPLGNS